jgi:hypothetical protein
MLDELSNQALSVELIGSLDHDIGRAGDQIMGLQQAVNRRL